MLIRVRMAGATLTEFDAAITPRVGESISVAGGRTYRIIQIEYAVMPGSKPNSPATLSAIIVHVR